MVNKKSIATKMTLLSSAIVVALSGVAFGYTLMQSNEIYESEIKALQATMNKTFDLELSGKTATGSAVSVAVIANTKLTQAVVDKNTDLIAQEVANLNKQMKAYTENQNTQVRIVDATGKTLHASWNPKLVGQDLSKIPRVANYLKEQKPYTVIGVSTIGIQIISGIPIFQDNQFYGFINYVQGFKSISSKLKENSGVEMVQILDKHQINDDSPFVKLKENPKVTDRFVISNPKWFDEQAINHLKKRFEVMGDQGVADLLASGMRDGKEYLISALPIAEEGKTVGYNVLLKPKADVNAVIEQKQDEVWTSFYMSVGSMVVVMGLFLLMFNMMVARGLKKTQEAIAYSVAKGDLTHKAPETGNGDEVDLLAKAFNARIAQTKGALDSFTNIMEALSRGEIKDSTGITTAKGNMAEFVKVFDATLRSVKSAFERIEMAAQLMSESKFAQVKDIKTDGLSGQYQSVLSKVIGAGNQIDHVVAEISVVMHQVSQGRFDKCVDAHCQNQLGELQISINETLATLKALFEDLAKASSSMSHGDLTHRINTQMLDGAYAQVGNGFNQGLSSVAKFVNDAKGLADQVNSISSKLLETSDQVASQIQEQAAAVEQTASAMEESVSSIKQTQNNLLQARQLSTEQKSVLDSANKVMAQTITAMNGIESQSSKMSEIVSVIDSIAFQTNLLALNAAVEAARAGEHGRGFAVVASEVRALAGKSSEAAKDIKELIDTASESIKNGVGLVANVSEQVSVVTSETVGMQTLISDISQAANEQLGGVEEVNRSMALIEKTIQQNAAEMERVREQSQNAGGLSDTLANNLSQFKC